MGKTEVCKKIFHEYYNARPDNIKYIGWINYEVSFKDSVFRNIDLKQTRNLTAQDGKTIEDIHFEVACRFLNQNGDKVLLFIDNMNEFHAEDIEEILSLPSRIIITTRINEIDGIESIPVDRLQPEECKALYISHLTQPWDKIKPEEIEAIEQIIELADYHTLTVELLAKTQKANHINACDLLDELKKSGFDLSKLNKKTVKHKTKDDLLIDHLQRLFDLTKIKKNSEELRVLKIFSVMPYTEIKHEYAKVWLEDEHLSITDGLVEKGWVIGTEDGYLVHPVLASVIQKENKPSDDEIEYLIPLLADELYLEPKEIFTSKLYFLDFAVQLIKNYEQENEEAGRLCNQIALRYDDIGNYKSALEYYLKALKIREEELGESHPSTATTYNNLAGLYRAKGDYENALEYNLKALKIKEEELGESHSDTAITYNNLAGLYESKGDYENALEYYLKALKISEEVLGESHPYTAVTYGNLAELYRVRGEYENALKYYLKALKISKEVLGESHPSTAATYNNLALLYKSMGDYENALKYDLKALKISEAVLGESHPDTATNYNNLAGLYYAKGDYENALEYYLKALKISEEVLGESHPSTAVTYNNLAALYRAKGDYENAIKYHLKALAIAEEVLGASHPNTIMFYENLSFIYEAIGDQEKSLEYLKKSQNK